MIIDEKTIKYTKNRYKLWVQLL